MGEPRRPGARVVQVRALRQACALLRQVEQRRRDVREDQLEHHGQAHRHYPWWPADQAALSWRAERLHAAMVFMSFIIIDMTEGRGLLGDRSTSLARLLYRG